MRKFLTILAMMALAGCGGGGGANTAPNPPPVTVPTTTPSAGLVTPQFTINLPPRTSSNGRDTKRVSSAAGSVTITRTSQPSVVPTSKTTDLTALQPCPCTVDGPPSPPGVVNDFTVATFQATNGSGLALDQNSISFTPTVGTTNTVSIVLKGIARTVTITNVPAAFGVGGAPTVQSQALTVTAKDAASVTIASGTYFNPITVTDPDANGAQGTQLSGTNPGTCPPGTCVVLNTVSDTVTLNYEGLAEDPVTLSATGTSVTTGTATFTPVLQPITLVAGGPTTLSGGGPGIDLFTIDNTSPTGYSGKISYKETGYTESPYLRTLTTINGTSCAAFASIAASNNANNTDFTATATANVSGICTRVVSDGLAAAGHGNGGPSFKVTYTTSSVSASSKHRKQ